MSERVDKITFPLEGGGSVELDFSPSLRFVREIPDKIDPKLTYLILNRHGLCMLVDKGVVMYSYFSISSETAEGYSSGYGPEFPNREKYLLVNNGGKRVYHFMEVPDVIEGGKFSRVSMSLNLDKDLRPIWNTYGSAYAGLAAEEVQITVTGCRSGRLDGLCTYMTAKRIIVLFDKCTENLFLDYMTRKRSIVSAREMFSYCYNMVSVKVGGSLSGCRDFYQMFYNSGITDTSVWPSNNVDDTSGMYAYTRIETVNHPRWGVAKIADGMFQRCWYLKYVSMDRWDFSQCESCQGMVTNCANLESVDFGVLSLKSFKGTAFPVGGSGLEKLKTLTGSVSGIRQSLNFRYSPLSYDSVKVLINGLDVPYDGNTKDFSLKASSYVLLSEEDIALVTSKGWNLIKV